MADDEQFSLCWNNFNSNLSAGFHESLCRGDLVDVTLAAEGQFVKAHRLVLSVCSPYFRKMFTQMPANQHAFVFLKDVSHTALKDLIQFMYCGEVNVKQEALPAFISTAEALQIKGLTDSDPPQSQTPPEPSTPTPQIQHIQTSPRVRQRTSAARSYKIETVEDSGDDAKQTTQIVIQTTAPTHPPQTNITTQPQQQQPQHLTQQALHTQTHQLTSVSMPAATTATVVTQKRPAQRTSLGSVTHIKRSKSTVVDPLEASDATAATHQINVQTSVVTDGKPQVHHHHQQQHQTHHQQAQQQTHEPEYIDLPIDLPTKSEPDYAEETGEVDQADQDTTYVEDESYGDMRYDESYFTENEDATAAATGGNTNATTTQNTSTTTATTSKAVVKQQTQSLSDSSYMDTTGGDPANSDAQDKDKLQKLLEESVANRKKCQPQELLVACTKLKTRKYVWKYDSDTSKIFHTIESQRGKPIIAYASAIKGPEVFSDGYRFRFVTKRDEFSFYRCCYQTKEKQCSVRIVIYKNLAYHYDGSHSHKLPPNDERERSPHTVDITPKDLPISKVQNKSEEVDNSISGFINTTIKEELITSDESLEFTSEVSKVTPVVKDPRAFRQKIKERLQKRLSRKSKKFK